MNLPVQPQSCFVTRDFAVAWQVYRQWLDYQERLGQQHQVKLAGCRVNDYNCWEVLITQQLHDKCLQQCLV